MSHLTLRRVMIRLLHDPTFAARLYADPAVALADLDLDADERAWLLATPPAAWRTDPARPARVGAALAEEYPATTALDPERAATFFASPSFHAAVQERGSLALAFGAHLAAADDPRVRALARLERAVAMVRRAAPGARQPTAGSAGDTHPTRPQPTLHALAPTTPVTLAPHARLVTVPEGALDLLAALRAGRPAPALRTEDESVLVVAPRDGTDVTIEPLAPALAALLARAAAGATYADLLEEAGRNGADPGEEPDIVGGLFKEGLLVAADDSRV